jgi:hypothetical protein
MELALVLTLRVYQVVPDSILVEVVRHWRLLWRLYRHAYDERCTGIGKDAIVKLPGRGRIRCRGAYLDLQINFAGGKLVKFGPPRVLSPFQALKAFAERDVSARALLPINLSLLAERVVSKAVVASGVG